MRLPGVFALLAALVGAAISSSFVLAEPITIQDPKTITSQPLVSAALNDTGFSVTPLKTVPLDIAIAIPANQSLNATDNPLNIPLTGANAATLFHAGNVIKIDTEYLLITGVTPSNVTALRAQLGSTAVAHPGNAAILRVYQLDVMLESPNDAIGAYQLNVTYDSARLSIVSVNVFPGTGALGVPVAVNTNNPGLVILNSFNAVIFFQGVAVPIARLYFTGTAPGTVNPTVSLTNVADKVGKDITPITSTITAALNPPSLTVTSYGGLKKVRGQITSQ